MAPSMYMCVIDGIFNGRMCKPAQQWYKAYNEHTISYKNHGANVTVYKCLQMWKVNMDST